MSSNETPTPDPVSWHVGRLFIAWGVAAAIGILVTIFASTEARFQWLALAVGLTTLVTFALQLGTAQREGFISRLSFSIAGSVLTIGAIDGVGLIIDRLAA